MVRQAIFWAHPLPRDITGADLHNHTTGGSPLENKRIDNQKTETKNLYISVKAFGVGEVLTKPSFGTRNSSTSARRPVSSITPQWPARRSSTRAPSPSHQIVQTRTQNLKTNTRGLTLGGFQINCPSVRVVTLMGIPTQLPGNKFQ